MLLIPTSFPSDYDQLRGAFFRDHALALRRLNHDVVVMAVVLVSLLDIRKHGLSGLGMRHFSHEGLRVFLAVVPSVPKLRWLNNRIRVAVGMVLLRRVLRRTEKITISHVHGYLAGDIARYARNRFAIPYIVTEHSSAFSHASMNCSQRFLASRVFKDALERTAVSTPLASLLSQSFQLGFQVTPNPISRSFRDLEYVDSVRNDIAQKTDGLRITCLALMSRNKRHDRLINAFANVVKRYPRAILDIGGDGPEKKGLKRLVHATGLGDRVRFRGRIPRNDVPAFLAGSDLFALPSEYETFGVVVIEAMALGVPVVSTRCGGPEDIITEDWMGILTDNTDAGFTAGLMEGMRGIETGRFDGERIIAEVHQRYSLETVGGSMSNLYNAVLREK